MNYLLRLMEGDIIPIDQIPRKAMYPCGAWRLLLASRTSQTLLFSQFHLHTLARKIPLQFFVALDSR